ncbi:MAG TPA: AAA family ATPase [Usitatibacter sp.]|nr:AAA family ATPase [Usitatibacter sp.]
MTLPQALAEFRDFISRLGFDPPPEITLGSWCRFSTNGRQADQAGSCKLFDDLGGGVVIDHRSGDSWVWHGESGNAQENGEQRRARVERAKAEAKAEHEKSTRATSERACNLWAMAKAADDSHPYLLSKAVKPHGVRVFHGPLTIGGMACDGALIVPAHDLNSNVVSLSFITMNGKRYLPGPRAAGCYFMIGEPTGKILIAEGYATAASLHEASGTAVAVAFDAGNLGPVATTLRKKYPDIELVVCADDDAGTDGNPGLTKATAAAWAADALLAAPDFGSPRPDGVTDFNDMVKHMGLEAVRAAVARAARPEAPKLAPVPAKKRQDPCVVRPEGDGGRPIFRRFSDIESRPIRWLWPGRIARGKVSMIAGNPGLGKSQLTASMAAIVTRGGRWPVDRTECIPGSVIFLSAEDDPADTIRPRLEAAGADLDRCVILEAVTDGYTSSGDEVRRSFNLKTDLARLADALVQVGDVAMVVIDPISAYLGGTDSHNNAEVRALLAPLSEVAAAHGAAMIGVSHLNKGGGSNEALMRVTGSLAFVAAARSGFVVTADRDAPGRRLFLPMKNNLGPDLEGLAFAIQSHVVDSGGQQIETSRVVWEGVTVTITADEAMAPQLSPDDRSEVDDAKAFLADMLSAGPVPSKRVRSEADGCGHAWATIRRAQKALGVEATKEGMAGPWMWRLPPKMLKKSEDAQPQSVSAFGKSEHLRLVPAPSTDVEIF